MDLADEPSPHRQRPAALQLAPLVTLRRLAQHGSYTRTAAALGLSQPAVSQHVRSLERHFGIKLVDLIGRRVTLTAAGSFLAERTARILDEIEATEREMRHYAGAATGELRLGSTITIGSYTLTPLLQRFRTTHPGILISVILQNTQSVAAMVKRRELDLALVEGALDDDELETVSYAEDKLALIVSPKHRFAGRRAPFGVRLLADEPFISREGGSSNRRLVDAAFARAGLVPHTILELGSAEATGLAVAAGIGVSIISSVATDALVADGRLVRIPIDDLALVRRFRIIRLRHTTPSPTADAFMKIVLAGARAYGDGGNAST